MTESERHRVLAAQRRRTAIEVLESRSMPVTLTELARDVAEREDGTGDTDQKRIEEVTVELHHIHLPLLDDIGLVHYNRSNHRVTSCHALLKVLLE